MELTIIISFIAGLAIGIAAMLVAYFRQKAQHAEQSQASGTRIQILEAQMQADRKHFEETKALAEENHRQALAAQEARFREAQGVAEENHRKAMEAQDARFREAQGVVEENHRQALAAQEARFREAQGVAEENHRKAMEAQDERFKESLARVTSEMRTATDEMLKQRQQEFSQSSTQNLGQIVTPLKETIEAMRKT